MNVKQYAVSFIILISSEYMLGAAHSIANAKSDSLMPFLSREKRQSRCQVKRELEEELDACLDRVRNKMDDSFDLDDANVDNYEMTQVTASGFSNFKRSSPYRCRCGNNSVRVYLEVSFLRILVTFVLNLLDDLLGGLLGSLGTALSRTLGNIVNLLVRVLALDIKVRIVILQKFVQGSRCVVESYRVTQLTKITLLNLDLSFVAEILSDLLVPVLDLLLQVIFTGRVRQIFVAEFQRMIITQDMIIC